MARTGWRTQKGNAVDILRHMPSSRDHFTILANAVIRDKRLSYRARGVLCALLSHRDGFHITSESLADDSPNEGRDAIRKSLTELAEAGYLRRPKRQDPLTGRWGTLWLVFPEGDAVAWDGTQPEPVSAGQPEDGFPGVGSADPQITGDGFSGAGLTCTDDENAQVSPTTGLPAVGEPAVGEPGDKRSTSEKDQEKSGQVSSSLTVGGAPAPPADLIDAGADASKSAAPAAPAAVLLALGQEAFRDVPPTAKPDTNGHVLDLLRRAADHGWTGAQISDAITADHHNYAGVTNPAGLVVRSLERIASLPAPAAPQAINEPVCDTCNKIQSQCQLAQKTDPDPHPFTSTRGRYVDGHWQSQLADESDAPTTVVDPFAPTVHSRVVEIRRTLAQAKAAETEDEPQHTPAP